MPSPKIRDWNAIKAHFRKAGAHKSGPRGGASNSTQDYLEEYYEECAIEDNEFNHNDYAQNDETK